MQSNPNMTYKYGLTLVKSPSNTMMMTHFLVRNTRYPQPHVNTSIDSHAIIPNPHEILNITPSYQTPTRPPSPFLNTTLTTNNPRVVLKLTPPSPTPPPPYQVSSLPYLENVTKPLISRSIACKSLSSLSSIQEIEDT